MTINIIIKTKYGDYKSKDIIIEEEDYDKILDFSKNFYMMGYEMETDTGFIVIPPDVIKDSILLIERNETTQGEI
jgi:hypothetical protein